MKSSFDLRPEQWVIFGAFIFLGVVGLVKAFTLPDIQATIPGGKMTDPDSYDTAKIATIEEEWNQPLQLNATDHKVYVSRLIVFKPAEQVIVPLDDAGIIQGMTVGWLKENKLSLEDPNVAIGDPDQDGFSNLEEFKAGTKPRESENHPDLISKLCVKDYEFIPFIMEFKGYNPDPGGDGLVYQIKLPKVRGRNTRMVRKGEDLEGYTIGDYRKIIVDEYNEATGITEKVDRSELIVIHPILKTPVTLIYNKEIESDESRVVLKLDVPNVVPEPASLKRGEIFKIKDVSYQYISATAENAVVKQLESGEQFTIPQCDP